MKHARQWLGLGLLVLAALGVGGYKLVSSATSGGHAAQPISARGLVGGEKLGFLEDPQVQKILSDRYDLSVDATKAGSIEMVRGSTAGQDFLWPSSQVALDLYKQQHGGAADSSLVFNSPIVLYAWAPVADALIKAGIVRKESGTYYVTQFPRLVHMVLAGKPWSSLGLGQLYGPISIFTTDPTKSNSGLMFAGLLADTLNGNQVVDNTTLGQVLPDVSRFYNRLGFLDSSSADLFDQFLKTGIGAKPIIAGYENQLIEYSIANPSYQSLLRKSVRELYPRPTVWSEHAFIALNPKGKKLLNALNDADIQKLAWERHGFRSGIATVQNDPQLLKVIGVPQDLTVIIPVPRFQVMDRIIKKLS